MRLGRVSQPPAREPPGGWDMPCLSAQQCSPGVGKERVEKRVGPREICVRRRQSSPYSFLLLDAPSQSCGISVHTHIHANRQTRVCRSCQYKLARWCYFSLIWFLSNLPEAEISQQNQCVQKQELMRRLPFYFCLDSAFKVNVPQLK